MLGRTVLVVAALVVAGAAPAAAAPTVAIAGDSIIDRSRLTVRNAIEPEHDIVWFGTKNSATIARLGPELLEAVRQPGGPDIVLVELGTGNAFWGTTEADFRAQVRDLTRRLLRHATCVRWFEQRPPGNRAYPRINARANRFNAIVREVVNGFARARTVHYAAWTRQAGDGIFVPDLLHLNARGKRGLARLALQAVEGCDPAVTSGPFWDVPDRHWAAEAIAWAGQQRFIDGYANDSYRAEVGGLVPSADRLTWLRALWRRAGRPGGFAPTPWSDAPPGAARPLAWAWAEQITQVRAGGRLRPAAPLTRGEAIGWLYRAEGRPDVSSQPPHGLTDVPPGLARAVRWANGVGITRVPAGGRFRPHDRVTRALAAVLLHRAANPAP